LKFAKSAVPNALPFVQQRKLNLNSVIVQQQKRKRIETLFSQFKGQFAINVNFAKTFAGLATGILSKITSLLMIQYLNLFVLNRKMNRIKMNIC
jgi:hypothetical protein